MSSNKGIIVEQYMQASDKVPERVRSSPSYRIRISFSVSMKTTWLGS